MKTRIKFKNRTLAPENVGSAARNSRRKFLTGAAGAVAGAATMIAAPNVSRAQTTVLKMQGSWGAEDVFNEMAEDYVTRVNEMSGDRLRIDYLVAGAVVKPFSVQDAVHTGVLDAGHTVPVYWYGKNKAASLFGSAYLSLDEDARYVVAGRLAIGSIMGASVQDVPADRRFYAGGGGSVRGYAYQGIGPRDADGQPIGGLSVVETSVELRFAITDTIGIVPFVDAGTVSEEQYPDFQDFKVGAGIGLRYLTPFGPLRVDGAIPLNREPGDPDFGIYAGIGQAF